jgi:hypothetical protein
MRFGEGVFEGDIWEDLQFRFEMLGFGVLAVLEVLGVPGWGGREGAAPLVSSEERNRKRNARIHSEDPANVT